MNKQKYYPYYNCYKHYSQSDVTICYASFPCMYLAQNFTMFYAEFLFPEEDVNYYVKRESAPKFE